jgi:succinate dehydrogenase / fumarate reductase iron-sulfur subunit
VKLTLEIWRQDGPRGGAFASYEVDGLTSQMSLLEALDVLNERLVARGERPVAFDSDCREGICGSCGLVVDGQPHGPRRQQTTCQLTLAGYRDGARLRLAPFDTGVFPVLRDLVVDRGALDRIIAAGGYVSTAIGSAPEANSIPVAKPDAERALDAAACIGCGACVAACPNGSAALFTAAKLGHLDVLPQGAPERDGRALALVRAADREGFGGCTLHGECQRACPKGIGTDLIVRLNREHLGAVIRARSAR